MAQQRWSRDELILAMNLYCQLPFGRLHSRNPEIIQLAEAIGRTPSSVAMKLCNFASLDPAHQERGVRGLGKVAQADRDIWSEFHNNWNQLAAESEQLRLAALGANERLVEATESSGSTDEPDASFSGATERKSYVRVRLAQGFFRRAVLASYDSQCCICGISHASLLVASHILPWSKHPEHRADPRNGLCLSRLHDAAFDNGLITLDSECRLVLSRELADTVTNRVLTEAFHSFRGRPVKMPQKFRPRDDFLETHRTSTFRG